MLEVCYLTPRLPGEDFLIINLANQPKKATHWVAFFICKDAFVKQIAYGVSLLLLKFAKFKINVKVKSIKGIFWNFITCTIIQQNAVRKTI